MKHDMLSGVLIFVCLCHMGLSTSLYHGLDDTKAFSLFLPRDIFDLT